MKHPVIAALLTLWSFAAVAQTAPVGEPKALSSRDQIKANRAKENADEAKDKNGPRPWDRDVNGKRPWDDAPQNGRVGGLPPP